MNQKPDLSKLKEVLASAQRILVAIPENPNLDKVAASLSFSLSLKKAGKTTTVVCPQEMTVEFSQLVGVDKVTNKIGSRNLMISLDYVKDSIEKVSYNVEGDKFNLVIQPKSGFSPLDAKNVSYSYSGADSELIFVIGAQRLEDLGSLYESERSLFVESQVVNVDYHSQNTQFGKINIFNSQASSYSEIVVAVLRNLGLPFDQDVATDLLIGLKSATNNFQSPTVTANTFETAAFCLRSGAKQSGKKRPSPSPDWLAPKIYKGKTQV